MSDSSRVTKETKVWRAIVKVSKAQRSRRREQEDREFDSGEE